MLQISYPSYLDKVHGGWIGKCIGGAVGAMQENNKSLMDYTIDNVFPQTIPPNDDLDLQVLYLQEVLEKKGSRITARDLGDAFARYNLCLANEYAVAIKNIELGIKPPLSGVYNNAFFANSMGCPIRSEIWGFICPGNPDAAVSYAAMDSCIDHGTESMYGEQFYAALEACAFFEQDLTVLIEAGLSYVPQDSRLYRCIRYVQQLHGSGIEWKSAREALVQHYGSPDASYSVINLGLTILALLYGEGDMTRTLLAAVNGGFDTDCTAATAGAILGVILGAEKIPEFWLNKIGPNVVIGTVDIKRPSDRIIDLAQETCSAGLSLIRDGIISVRVTGVPAGVLPSLPLPAAEPEVEFIVDYPGLPSIGYGEKTCVNLTLVNHSGKAVSATLRLDVPPALLCNLDRAAVHLLPGNRCVLPLEFHTAEGIKALPQKNIVQAVLETEGKILGQSSFGLSGAVRMKVIGPFWDHYDTSVYDQDPYKGVTQRKENGWADLRAMFNSYVNIDRQYLNETFTELDRTPGEYANFHEDKLDLNQVVSYPGPCCLYLVYDFICPEDREHVELYVGNNDSYKIWLNGQLVVQDRGGSMWMPYNNYALELKLHKGANRIVAKVIRSGHGFDFSFQMRSYLSLAHWFTDLASIVEK